jgi:hypothetical protein
MTNICEKPGWVMSVLGLALTGIAGCQTWVPEAGVTVPSPHYLRHRPQYIPPSPPFPLSRELSSLEEAAAQQNAVAPRPGVPGGP